MIKPIMRDIFFLNQKSELATEQDKQDGNRSAGYTESK